MECVQTDNNFEFTNRLSNSKRNHQTLFEATASDLGVQHKLIRPYALRHNGKVERNHREDQKRFYNTHRFWSRVDLGWQLAVNQGCSNFRLMRPLDWLSPRGRKQSLHRPRSLTNLHFHIQQRTKKAALPIFREHGLKASIIFSVAYRT